MPKKHNGCVAKWAELPAPALEQIFTHLSHKERFWASMVCRNWSTVYGCPLLWRSPVFRFPGTKFEAIGYAGKKFVKRYGKYFRHLYMMCERPTFRGRFPMQIAMCKTFKSLTNSAIKIESLEMRKLTTYHSWRTVLRTKVLTYFRRFLRTQNDLKRVDLTRADVFSSEGLRIIRILSRKCGPSIEELHLRGFLRRKIFIHKIRVWANMFSNFHNLQVLDMNYSMMSDYLMNALISNVQGTLREMKICVPYGYARFANVSATSWTQLKTACPDLLVDFDIEGFNDQLEYQRILPRTVPLRKLTYISPIHKIVNNLNYDSMFQYFGSFRNTFEKLSLKIHSSERRLPFAMRALFPVCHSLERIDMIMPLPVYFLDRLFNTLRASSPALKIFRLTLIDVGRENFRHRAENIRKKYVPLLKDVGIKLQLVVKK